MAVDFEWRLTCSPKNGRKGCEGKIEVVPPKRKFEVEVRLPADGERTCEGTCKKVTDGPAFVRMYFDRRDQVVFRGQTFRFKLKTASAGPSTSRSAPKRRPSLSTTEPTFAARASIRFKAT